jgi:hypothetical protein
VLDGDVPEALQLVLAGAEKAYTDPGTSRSIVAAAKGHVVLETMLILNGFKAEASQRSSDGDDGGDWDGC